MNIYKVDVVVKGSMAGPSYSFTKKVMANSYDEAVDKARFTVFDNFRDRYHGTYTEDIVIKSIRENKLHLPLNQGRGDKTKRR